MPEGNGAGRGRKRAGGVGLRARPRERGLRGCSPRSALPGLVECGLNRGSVVISTRAREKQVLPAVGQVRNEFGGVPAEEEPAPSAAHGALPVVFVLGKRASRVSYEFLIRGKRGSGSSWQPSAVFSGPGLPPSRQGRVGSDPCPAWVCPGTAGKEPPRLRLSRKGDLLCTGMVANPEGLRGTFR